MLSDRSKTGRGDDPSQSPKHDQTHQSRGRTFEERRQYYQPFSAHPESSPQAESSRRAQEQIQAQESSNSRDEAKEILDEHPYLLSYAYNYAKRQHGENSQIAIDLKIIQEFEADDQTLKAAMSRIIKQTDDNRIIQQVSNLIEHNPQIKPFYSQNEGQIRAESDPAQDTDSTMRKKHAYLDKIPDKTITDLAGDLSHGGERYHLPSFKLARDACNKIKLFRNLYSKFNIKQAKSKYGDITKDQAAIAALDLRNALNQQDLASISSIASYRSKMNQYSQEAGLS
jgi:hypothetical protein